MSQALIYGVYIYIVIYWCDMFNPYSDLGVIYYY